MTAQASYATVLIPTDGSETATVSVDHAVELARQYGATLHGLYVVDTAAVGSDLDAAMIQDALESRGESVLGEFEETATAAGVEGVETAIRSGAPHRAILSYADEHDVDLIVMGTHGRRGLRRYLLGSVTEKVVRLADVPVLTVHSPSDDE